MLFSQSDHWQQLSVRSVYRPSPFDGRPFHWVEAGQGEEIVIFLHGIMAHSMAFRCVLEASAHNYRVIVPDLPGHGRDETFHSDIITPSIDGLLRWLEGFLETLDGESVHLVGHSLGATLSFMAALDSDRFSDITTLTLVSPGLQIRVPLWTGALLGKFPARLARLGTTRTGIRLYEPFQWRRARMNKREMSDYLSPIQEVRRMRHMLGIGSDLVKRTGSLEGASSILQRTLIMWGDSDLLLPLPTAYQLRDRIPNSQLEVFENCGHCPMEDCPTDFHKVLSQFLGPSTPDLNLAQ